MHIYYESRDLTQCPLGGTWYSCSVPQFAGCCLVEACSRGGCPKDKDRTPSSSGSISAGSSHLTSNAVDTIASASAAVITVASVSASQSHFATVTSAPAPTPLSTDNSIERPNNNAYAGAIAGGTIGGVVLLAIAVFLVWFLRRRRCREEERRATLPPQYPGARAGDMSEHLSVTTTAIAPGGKAIIPSGDDASLNAVQQLDSTAIFPTNEANMDALGCIPELPATERHSNPFTTPNQSEVAGSSIAQEKNADRDQEPHDPDNHVMSWSQFNSMGNRSALSRLSQPHIAPDATVWENMSPSKPKKQI